METQIMVYLNQMDFFDSYIYDAYQEYLYSPDEISRKICERIRNASLKIRINAWRVLRNQRPIITAKKGQLDFKKSRDLIYNIYKIMGELDFLVNKERKIRKMIQEDFGLNPNELLENFPPQHIEEIKIKKILNDE